MHASSIQHILSPSHFLSLYSLISFTHSSTTVSHVHPNLCGLAPFVHIVISSTLSQTLFFRTSSLNIPQSHDNRSGPNIFQPRLTFCSILRIVPIIHTEISLPRLCNMRHNGANFSPVSRKCLSSADQESEGVRY